MAKSHEVQRRTQEEAYLAEATSIYDLEWRMRKLDRHDWQQSLPMMIGLR